MLGSMFLDIWQAYSYETMARCAHSTGDCGALSFVLVKIADFVSGFSFGTKFISACFKQYGSYLYPECSKCVYNQKIYIKFIHSFLYSHT